MPKTLVVHGPCLEPQTKVHCSSTLKRLSTLFSRSIKALLSYKRVHKNIKTITVPKQKENFKTSQDSRRREKTLAESQAVNTEKIEHKDKFDSLTTCKVMEIL